MTDQPQEPGFEYQGRFYRWSITQIGKDLMLIDRITGMSLPELYDAIDDEHQRGRGSVQLAMIATSLRAGNPEWTVQRIVGIIESLDVGTDIGFLAAEEDEQLPPPKPQADVVPLKSTSSDSSPSSTPAETSDSETSYATPV